MISHQIGQKLTGEFMLVNERHQHEQWEIEIGKLNLIARIYKLMS